jgi:hypothetical protein
MAAASGASRSLAMNESTPVAKEQEEEIPEEDLEFKLSTDAYDAVVAAAFNGVRLRFPSKNNGAMNFVRLHPLAIFVFCVMLLMIQFSCLSCLVLDMNMENIFEGATWEGFDESPRRQMMVVIRSIMVIVLQLIAMKELIGSLKPLLFVINPITWQEIDRPGIRGEVDANGDPVEALSGAHYWNKKLYNPWLMAPVCACAQLMQFGIAYYVLIVSMSIIMEAQNVKDVIFNGLVVTFLADLDEYAWVAAATVFHMDLKTFEDFEFRIAETRHADGQIKSINEERDNARHSWKIWLYRGKGGRVSVLESLLIFSGMGYLYIRQLFMFIQGMHTGILPVARDVCELYRALALPDPSIFSVAKLKMVETFTLINYNEMLTETIHKNNLKDECMSAEYKAGPFDAAMDYITWWPKNTMIGCLGILILFGLPQIIYANYVKVLKALGYHPTLENLQKKDNDDKMYHPLRQGAAVNEDG